MKIVIQNYKNILSGELTLKEGKLNVLFGVSGIGKSSIAESLNPNKHADNRSYLPHSGEVTSLIDGVPSAETDALIFSPSSRILIREMAEEEDGYDLLVDDRKELEIAENDLANLLDGFLVRKPDWDQAIESLRELNKALKNKAIGKDKNQLQKSSLLRQFLNACETGGKPVSVVREIESMGSEKARWINDGYGFIRVDDAIGGQYCPYCDKQMGDTLRRRAERLHSFEVEAVTNMDSLPGTITEFGDPTSMASNRSSVLSKAIGLLRLVEEYDDLCSLLEQIRNGSLPIKSRSLQKDYPNLYERFPEIKTAMDEISKQYVHVKNAQIRAKRAAADSVKRKRRFVNEQLEHFGIPYRIEYECHNRQIVGARIIHKLNNSATDDSDRLSEGEKTIVAFVIFTLRAEAATKAKLIVLDDPLSNFNNERKQELFSLIQSKLSNRTIMLLTYDQAFVKIALGQRRSTQKLIDSAQFISNENGTLKSKPITKDDFVHIYDAAQQACTRCEKSSYLRKIANLRYYYELKIFDGQPRPSGEIAPKHVYSYLSGILHGLNWSRVDFDDRLAEFFAKLGFTEDELIEQIKRDTKLELPVADYGDLHSGSFDDFQYWLEKAIVLREAPSCGSVLKTELSNLVHLNSILAICLNPFEFETCSSYISDALGRVAGPISNLFPPK